ncbi:type II toxin-antitoxin system prevent-host-death family antitoxin [Nostocoides sp. F2B08]|uniref:type II toxin-antitoxin system Phd/YefM family antitoxin n=1 Tax=Nostocoides sp. F2B08 TaxID=2653936 RepID=UPI0012634226|nr:type II toxin-antitoxin system Phd/YefM family antitoxin [Tetrasphaera sp. F2B08]KAB7743315.1 type II toxin-antitoxin system prevent-host-death family antitoxin [Tetrasphaera sp. F2B08]
MQTLPISAAKARLSELVDEVVTTGEHVTITRNGTPAAVLISADEWEALQETLHWLSVPGIRDAIAEADADYAAGRTVTVDQLKAEMATERRGPGLGATAP